jgi:hypothetical protein
MQSVDHTHANNSTLSLLDHLNDSRLHQHGSIRNNIQQTKTHGYQKHASIGSTQQHYQSMNPISYNSIDPVSSDMD